MTRLYPDGTTETIEWEGSRVKSVTDRQNRKQSFVYNLKGQLTEVRDGASELIERMTYDNTGRLASWKNADAEIAWDNFDFEGNPKRTTQRRFKDGSGLTSFAVLLDEHVQEHRWNEHGERVKFSMPGAGALGATWTKWIAQSFDAMGNLTGIARLATESSENVTPLMTASYRATGRPDVRTVLTAGAPIVRTYAYDPTTSLLLRLDVTVDRTKASILGLTEQSVANSLLGALSGSQQVSPNFCVDPKNGITYQLNAMVPQYDINSPGSLMNLPVLGSTTGQNQILANVASLSRSQTSPVMDRFNIRPVINIYGGVDGRDLGAVAREVRKAIDSLQKELPRGGVVTLRGQVATMQDSFFGLYVGLVFSMVLVYLLMVVNFQSWSEPVIIITALPVALAGIMWMLFVTQTTLSVPALMGAIMCMGVATANSVLVITFANERYEATRDSYLAALEAGYTRVRPVLMTAGAMIIGMFPMALGLGEGGEQNAPLGRAVIGGLIFATGATLFFVPTVFKLVRRKPVAPIPEPARS
jgi:YD repeat-containing protein